MGVPRWKGELDEPHRLHERESLKVRQDWRTQWSEKCRENRLNRVKVAEKHKE